MPKKTGSKSGRKLSARRRYRKGYRLEQRASDQLEALGYYVLRSAGSHGPADLVALSTSGLNGIAGPHVRLVQVKANRPPSRAQRAELRALRRRLRGLPITVELWRYNDRQRSARIEVIR